MSPTLKRRSHCFPSPKISRTTAAATTTSFNSGSRDLQVESLLTAPGYVQMVHAQYTKHELVLKAKDIKVQLITTKIAISINLVKNNGDDNNNNNNDHGDDDDVQAFHDIGLNLCDGTFSTEELDEIRHIVMEFIQEVQDCFDSYHPSKQFGKDSFVFREIGSRGNERFDALAPFE